MSTFEAIVIGGGITGCATAYELSKRGVQVTLMEREHLHAMGSGWTLAGVRQSGRHPAELPLARVAIERWGSLADELEADLHYRRDGNLRLALNPEQVETIRQVVADGNAAGVPMEYLEGADAVRELAPAVVETVAGASFCPSDGHADNLKAVQAYADAAQRHGTRILTGVEVLHLATNGDNVTGVVTTDGTYNADVVIVAAGIYSPQLLTQLGYAFPLNVVHCPVAETVTTDSLKLAPVLGVAAANFAARQTVEGAIRFIGASAPWEGRSHNDSNTGMTVAQMDAMTRNALAILPGLADLRVMRAWGGLIDRTPDALPVIDAPQPGLVIGAGYSGHGFGIGPVSGEILANLATEGAEPRFDLSPFAIDRFAGDGVDAKKLEMLG